MLAQVMSAQRNSQGWRRISAQPLVHVVQMSQKDLLEHFLFGIFAFFPINKSDTQTADNYFHRDILVTYFLLISYRSLLFAFPICHQILVFHLDLFPRILLYKFSATQICPLATASFVLKSGLIFNPQDVSAAYSMKPALINLYGISIIPWRYLFCK